MEPADDDRLLDIAAAITDRTAVDWDDVRTAEAPPADAAVLEQLQVLDRIAGVHADRTAWGSLSIREPLGHGSFGTVYRASDPALQREVALKVTQPHGTGGGFDPERLVREARLLARVRHPNVVTVFGAERHGDEVGVSMELIKGQTLHELVQRAGPYSAREAAAIGLDVCRALAAVHAAGLLHGDIKAQNVMREEGGRVVLMDFGSGRHLHAVPPLPATDFAGTPLYVAPEVFAGQPRSRASDVYGLGVLLYYLATGAYPVEGDTRSQIDRKHQERGERRRLRDVRPDLPDAFVRVVERAIAEDPAGRYQSAGELEAALTVALSGRGGAAARGDRRRFALAASAILAAGALAGTAYWTLTGDPPTSETAGATNTDVSVTATASPGSGQVPPAAADSYRIDAAVYRVESAGPVRLLPSARVATGDRLFLQIETSVAAHVYVVNEDDRGEHYLLFPLPWQATANPLPGGRAHRLPGLRDGQELYWQVSSAGGREHFLIFVSPERLSAMERIFAMLPPPGDQPVVATPLSNEAVGVLRGIGGLASAGPAERQPARLSGQFTTPLPPTAETASGLWVRQVTFQNPGR